MQATYCKCGKKNEYVVTKPKFCSACGTDMTLAFLPKVESFITAATTPVTSTPPAPVATPTPPPVQVAPLRRFVSPLAVKADTPAETSEEQREVEYYDVNVVHQEAARLKATMGGSAFEITAASGNKVKGSELFKKLMEEAESDDAPVKKTRRNSRKK